MKDLDEQQLKSVERLIRSIVAKLKVNSNELEDCLQAGRLGALESIEGFDPERGTFASHAYANILAEILEALDTPLVRVPRRTASRYYSLVRAAGSADRVSDRALKQHSMTRQNFTLVHAALNDYLFLDAPNPDGEPTELAEIGSPNTTAASPIDVEPYLAVLTDPRDRMTLSHLFGVDGHSKETAADIAHAFDMSPSAVARTKQRALSIIRSAQQEGVV